MVPTLEKLFGQEEEPQEDPPCDAPLPTISLPSGLLMLLLLKSDLGLLTDSVVLMGLASPGATPIFADALSLSPLIPIVHQDAGPSTDGLILIPKAVLFGQPFLVSISTSVDFFGPPTTLSEATGLMASPSPAPPLMLAMMMVDQLVDCLMKGAMVIVRKGKLIAQVSLRLVDLAKPPMKVFVGLVKGLILESCLD